MSLLQEYTEMFRENKQTPQFIEAENKKEKGIDYYLSTPEGKKQMLEIVHDFVENCDYEQIHKTMVALDWRWATLDDNRIPTEEDLKADLLDKFIRLFEDRCDRISSGGFTVGYDIFEPHPYEPDDFEHSVNVYYYFAVIDDQSIY